LVTSDDTAVAFTNSAVSITSADNLLANGKLVLDTTQYDGSALSFKVKYNANIGDPLYSTITYNNQCASQTVTATNNNAYTPSTLPTAGASAQINSSSKPSDDFTNSDAVNCPIHFSLVKLDGSALDGGLENIFSINADGFVQFDTTTWTGDALSA
jgi:hypothetical protein